MLRDLKPPQPLASDNLSERKEEGKKEYEAIKTDMTEIGLTLIDLEAIALYNEESQKNPFKRHELLPGIKELAKRELETRLKEVETLPEEEILDDVEELAENLADLETGTLSHEDLEIYAIDRAKVILEQLTHATKKAKYGDSLTMREVTRDEILGIGL